VKYGSPRVIFSPTGTLAPRQSPEAQAAPRCGSHPGYPPSVGASREPPKAWPPPGRSLAQGGAPQRERPTTKLRAHAARGQQSLHTFDSCVSGVRARGLAWIERRDPPQTSERRRAASKVGGR